MNATFAHFMARNAVALNEIATCFLQPRYPPPEVDAGFEHLGLVLFVNALDSRRTFVASGLVQIQELIADNAMTAAHHE
jgi:hypothetical protein